MNLRQAFYSTEILADSMKLADIVKLNHDELPRIMGIFELSHADEQASARRLLGIAQFETRMCHAREPRKPASFQRKME